MKRNAGKRSMLFTFAKTKKKTYLAFRAAVLTQNFIIMSHCKCFASFFLITTSVI